MEWRRISFSCDGVEIGDLAIFMNQCAKSARGLGIVPAHVLILHRDDGGRDVLFPPELVPILDDACGKGMTVSVTECAAPPDVSLAKMVAL